MPGVKQKRVRDEGGVFEGNKRKGRPKGVWGQDGLELKSILSVHSSRRRNDNHDALDVEDDDNDQTRLQGNFLMNIPALEDNFNKCFRKHRKFTKHCRGHLHFKKEYRKWGSGLMSGQLACTICAYESEFLRYYEEAVSSSPERKRRGRLPSKVGVQLQVACSKQPIGNWGMSQVFAACDIAPGSISAMQKASNRVMDTIVTINREQMEKNRDEIKRTMQMRTGLDDPNIIIMADSAYNNPPKGRSFCQPGTQVWQPVFCAEAGLTMPIDIATASKLCSCGNDKHGPDCRRNYALEKPIGNAEMVLAERSAKSLMVDGGVALSIGAIVTDGDSHVSKGFQNVAREYSRSIPEKADCTRHLTKTIGRNMMKADLKIQGRTKKERDDKQKKIAFFLQKRCSREFQAAYMKFGKNTDLMVRKCEQLVDGIIACIAGDGNTCGKITLMCKHKGNPSCNVGIPALSVDTTTDGVLRRWIRNKLGTAAVLGQRHNLTTNRCEASHLTTTKSVPKSRTYKRNFSGRVHSAAHSMSLGEYRSVLAFNKQLGAKNVYIRARKQLRKAEEKHQKIKKSRRYAQRRKRLRVLKKRINLKDVQHAGYAKGCQDPIVREDHRYQMP